MNSQVDNVDKFKREIEDLKLKLKGTCQYCGQIKVEDDDTSEMVCVCAAAISAALHSVHDLQLRITWKLFLASSAKI